MAIIGEPINAAVTSWGSGSDFVAKLVSQQSFNALVWNGSGSTFDASRFGGSANFTQEGQSLREVKFSLEAHILVPQDGLLGLVTFASGDALLLNGWEMTISRPLHDITQFGKTWKVFTPGLVSFAGSYEGFLDGATAPNGPLLSAGFANATFQVATGAGGKQLVGPISYTSTQGDVKRGSPATKSYGFKGSGALTTVGTSTNMLWPADASGALLSEISEKTLTLTYNTAMTISGSAYWNSIKITNKVGQPVKLNVDGMFSDTVTGLTV